MGSGASKKLPLAANAIDTPIASASAVHNAVVVPGDCRLPAATQAPQPAPPAPLEQAAAPIAKLPTTHASSETKARELAEMASLTLALQLQQEEDFGGQWQALLAAATEEAEGSVQKVRRTSVLPPLPSSTMHDRHWPTPQAVAQ